MHAATEKRSGRDNHTSCAEASSLQGFDSDRATVARLEHKPGDRALDCLQIWLLFKQSSDCSSIEAAIALGSWCPHSGALAAIQHSELNHGEIGGSSHNSSERIYLAHNGSFGDSADRRIA
jgi:hypothetical protein